MTGRQRMDYMKQKAAEYFRLRDVWRVAIQQGPVTGELAYVTSMVRKDVLRTDRLHPFYAGNDDNQNIASLFNILTTYALNHPAVSYCQGMSDFASPLLGLYSIIYIFNLIIVVAVVVVNYFELFVVYYYYMK